MLPDAPSQPKIPIFLRAMPLVDFCKTDPDPMRQLIWGITGDRYTNNPARESKDTRRPTPVNLQTSAAVFSEF